LLKARKPGLKVPALLKP